MIILYLQRPIAVPYRKISSSIISDGQYHYVNVVVAHCGERRPVVSGNDNLWIDRNLPEQCKAQLLSQCLAAAGLEKIRPFAALRTDISAHVFHDSDDRQRKRIAE